MLLKANRLKVFEFYNNPEKSQKFFYTSFTAFVKKASFPCSRFAIIVPKRLAKKAVVRNRVKRIIRTVLALYVNKTPKGTAILIKANKVVKKDSAIETDVKSFILSLRT